MQYQLTVISSVFFIVAAFDMFGLYDKMRRWPGRWSNSLGVNKWRWKVMAMELLCWQFVMAAHVVVSSAASASGADDWWGGCQWSSAVRSVVGWCIAMATAAEVAASWSSLIVIFGVMREVRQWERYLLHCDARKQKKSDEWKFESSYQKISSIWKIFAYDFSVWLSFFLSRVTIFKFERETKIITQ
jgi:hypothetical protein